MEFIDTHSHITDEAFAGQEEDVLRRALEAGISIMLQADISTAERPAMLAACDAHPDVLRPMIGLYPGCVQADTLQTELDAVEKALDERRDAVAVGEIGLDYHYSPETAELQKDALRIQLEMAAGRGLPVNIHLREATADFFDVLESCRSLGLRGNLHAFSGSAETFRRLARYGDWYVGIGGVLTFKNAGIAHSVQEIPLERIVLETDAPYLAPTPLRGTRNESANIPLIAAKLSELKQIPLETTARQTTANARALFRL